MPRRLLYPAVMFFAVMLAGAIALWTVRGEAILLDLSALAVACF